MIESSNLKDDENDPITFEELKGEDVVKMKCCETHFLKRNLVSYLKGNKKCFSCEKVFDVKTTGPQPTGEMTVIPTDITCQGHKQGTYEIRFYFPSGERDGQRYNETIRISYVPVYDENNSLETSNEILEIYDNLFENGYMFQIGTSATTSLFGVTYLIHQKSSWAGGSHLHGWPDPNYLARLKSECALYLPLSSCKIGV